MIVTTAQLYKVAYGKFAVGAYNINNMEQLLRLFRGNIQSKAPVIIQLSKGARSYADKCMLEAMIRAAEEIFPEAIFAVHLDHGDEPTCYDCIDSVFYSSVMIDASHEPFEQNVAITKRVVDRAHAKGISVEAELGMLGGVEEDISVDEKHACLTNPVEAVDFIKQTKCDSLAAAIGTSHGAYKFKGQQSLHFDVIEKIRENVEDSGFGTNPDCDARLIERAEIGGGTDQCGRRKTRCFCARRERGGIFAGSEAGVTKVNIDTDGRLVWTRVHREFFRDHPEKFDFRDPGKIFVKEYADFIAHKNEKLGSAGQLDAVRASVKK